MAKVVLPFDRRGEVVPLPPLCMSCGAPATHTLKMQFFDKATMRRPGADEEFVVVDAPLCEGHPFMGQARWMILFGFLLLLPLIGVAAVMDRWAHRYIFVFPIIALILVGSALILWVGFTSLGSDGFTKRGVKATNVSPRFVEALGEQEWTEDEFADALRENRGGRKWAGPPLWFSPWFYLPVGIGLAYLVFAPVGFVVASYQTEGPWPARQPGPPPGPAPGLLPPQEERRESKPLDPQSLPGLVAYWPLDENAGDTVGDKARGAIAFVRGGKWAEGVKGAGLQFNGKGDHVDLGGGPQLNFASGAAFTLACWARPEADEGAVCSFRRGNSGFPVMALLVKSGKLYGWVRDDASGFGGAKVTGGPIKDGKWHHAALTRRPDGTIEVFLDGVSQGRDKAEHSGGAITTDLRALGSDRFVAGKKKAGPPDFAGGVDEFCVFDRALDQKEIAILAGANK